MLNFYDGRYELGGSHTVLRKPLWPLTPPGYIFDSATAELTTATPRQLSLTWQGSQYTILPKGKVEIGNYG